MKNQNVLRVLLGMCLSMAMTGCLTSGSSTAASTTPTGTPGTGAGPSPSPTPAPAPAPAPADPSLSVVVQASSQTATAYAVVSLSLQKMLLYTGSGFAWEAQDGTQTALTLTGFDFANFQNIGLSAAGDRIYAISCPISLPYNCTLNRYQTNGAADSTFATATLTGNAYFTPQIIGEDASYIYFNMTQSISNGSALNVMRYLKTTGALDTTFGTTGIVTVEATYESSTNPVTNTPLSLDNPRMTIANGNLYFQAVSQVGRYIFILNQTDGSVVSTPSYFGGYEPWQVLGNNVSGNFRNSLEDGQTANGYFSYYSNNSGNLVVNQDGSLLSFEGGLVVGINADYSINTSYSTGGGGAVPYGLDLDTLAGTTNVRAIDAFQLPSGHNLIVYGINTDGTSQQVCGVIVDSTGTPIALTAPGTQPVCVAASWSDVTNDIPSLSMVPNSDGSTHLSVSNSDGSNTYTYLLNGTTLQSVSLTIEE